MAERLQVDRDTVESEAQTIGSAVEYFKSSTLTPTDTRTTLTANEKAKSAFETAQEGIGAFGAALNQEASNIRSLNVAFEEFDSMMGKLSANG